MKYEKHSKGDIKAYLIQDEDALNPFDDWDTLGTLVTWHRNYTFGGVNGIKEYPEGPQALLDELDTEELLRLPVYLFDHSGLTVSTKPFGCQWDSGQVGYIYITHKAWKDEFQGGKESKEEAEERAYEILRSEIEALDQLLTGDVWGVVVEKTVRCEACGDEKEEHLDSCWGFFGSEYAEQECERMFDAVVKHEEAA